MFDQIVTKPKEISEQDKELHDVLHTGDYQEFFRLAVLFRKNMAIVGETGSGKTTFCKTLCNLIPIDDRVITIEDVISVGTDIIRSQVTPADSHWVFLEPMQKHIRGLPQNG